MKWAKWLKERSEKSADEVFFWFYRFFDRVSEFFELIQAVKDGEIATTGKEWTELDRNAIAALKIPTKTIALEGEEPEVIQDLPKDAGWKDALEGYQGGNIFWN